MIGYLWKTTAGYRLTPWRSPYLRWRIETFWGLDAEHLSAGEFLRFCWQHRAELLRFLRWSERMDAMTRRAPRFSGRFPAGGGPKDLAEDPRTQAG